MKNIIKFGEFAPDVEDYDTPVFERIENAVPIYNGYSGILGLKYEEGVTAHAAGDYITGAYAHIVTQDLSVLHNKVDTTDNAGDWATAVTGSTTDLHEQIDEFSPDDSDRIFAFKSTINPNFTACQLGIEDITDPGGTANSDHYIDIRYRGFIDNGTAATITADIYQGTAQVTTHTSWTASVSTGDTSWHTKRVTLNDTDMDAITDWTDLELHISGSIAGMTAANPDLVQYPISDKSNPGQWFGMPGTDTTDIYAYIDDVTAAGGTPVDTTFVSTPVIPSDGQATYKCGLFGIRDIYDNANHDIKVRMKSGSTAGVDLRVRLMEDENVIGTTTYTDVGTSWTTETWTLSTAEADAIADYTNLDLEFRFSYDGSGPAQYGRPNSDVTVGANWETKSGGSTNLYQEIDEASPDGDATYIVNSGFTVGPGGDGAYKFTASSVTEPVTHRDTKLILYMQNPIPGSVLVAVRIYYDGTSNYYEKVIEVPFNDSWNLFTWHLTEAQSRNLDWGTDFTILIYKNSPSGTSTTLYLGTCWLYTPDAAINGFISDVWTEIPGKQGFEISWADFVTPSSQTEVTGDNPKIYAGTFEKLYSIDPYTAIVTDITRVSGDYGQTTTKPQCWDFCSWGGNVIATNRQDDVQYLDIESGATKFVKLIDNGSDLTPKAKFCDVVQNNLVLANINLGNYYSYSVMWSHLNDPTFFSSADYENLSDTQAVVQKPGEITGFVGGEFGTIFKRTSIHRMSFVGGSIMYRFDVIARHIGTAHPQSIVVVGDDIYFWGHNNFYIMPAGNKPIPISLGKVQEMLIESFWNERAIQKFYPDYQAQIDLSVVGTYDIYSGLIFWAIHNYRNSEPHMKTDILVYNPSTQKWGYIRDSVIDSPLYGISQLVCTSGLHENTNNLLSNLFVLGYGDPNDTIDVYKFSGHLEKVYSNYTDDLVFESKVISSKALTNDLGNDIVLKRVRPIFNNFAHRDYLTTGNMSKFWPRYEITIHCSNDPTFTEDVETITANYTDEDRDGWASVSQLVSGEYWKFIITVPSYPVDLTLPASFAPAASYYGLVRNFSEIQVDFEPAGMH